MIPIAMPQVGQDIPKGTVVQWLKKENDAVNKGETVLTVESEKAVFEVEAEESGVLLRILHREGAEVEILQPVGYIGQPGERCDETSMPASAGPGPASSIAEKQERVGAEHDEAAQPERLLASPAVRRLAHEKGVDLASLNGTGPDGRILKDDVLKAAGPQPVISADGDTVVPFGKMRMSIARRLTASKQTIPHFYLFIDVDMTAAVQWRHDWNARHGTHITATDLFVKAAAVALRSFPRLNAHTNDQQTTIKKNINIGVAVSVEDGLLVPVIADADQKSLQELSDLSSANAEMARRGVQRPGAVGTFTVSSLGMHGVRQFVPIINPPESAILAVGAIQPRVVPVPGGIGVREMVTLTLACDHRSVDGADAAGLLRKIKEDLEAIEDVFEQWG